MIPERRRHNRARNQLPLKIGDNNFDVITETVDISPTGIYCRISRLLPLMSKIDVMLFVPTKSGSKQTKKIRCRGVVVRTEPVILKETDRAHYNIAIFFTDISKKDQGIIASYVETVAMDENKVSEPASSEHNPSAHLI